jgi:carbon-monoxide dehydrogenase small subunit
MIERRWIVNGEARTVRFAPLARLLDVLRDEMSLLSVKEGCGEGECGACSVLIDGELHLACLVAAAQLEPDTRVLTAEGLEASELGRSLKQAFDRQGAVQCGYCSPAMLVGGYALLSRDPDPGEAQIRAGLAGHLCRCTGYASIVKAVQETAKEVGR